MRYLAILLLAPWLLLLGWAYWAYPKGLSGGWRRRMLDVFGLSLAAISALWVALLGFDAVVPGPPGEYGQASGAIWRQVLPALTGYGVFLGVLALALALRQGLFGRRR